MSVDKLIILMFALLSILFLTGLALFGARLLRQRLLEQKLRLEIANEGNTPTHFRLRAEHPDRLLTFRCRGQGVHMAAADSLPPKELIVVEPKNPLLPAQPVADPTRPEPANATRVDGLGARSDQAFSIARRLSSSLTSVATRLPRPLKGPLMRISSRLQQVQMRASYAQRQPQMLTRFFDRRPQAWAVKTPEAIPSGPSPSPDQQTKDSIPLGRRAWMETPLIAPGEAMDLQIKVLSSVWHKQQEHIFRLLSYPVEAPAEPWVMTQVPVHIQGGFWAHPYASMLVIVAVAVVVAVLALVLV